MNHTATAVASIMGPAPSWRLTPFWIVGQFEFSVPLSIFDEMIPSPFAIPNPPSPQQRNARKGAMGVPVRAIQMPTPMKMMPTTSCLDRKRVTSRKDTSIERGYQFFTRPDVIDQATSGPRSRAPMHRAMVLSRQRARERRHSAAARRSHCAKYAIINRTAATSKTSAASSTKAAPKPTHWARASN